MHLRLDLINLARSGDTTSHAQEVMKDLGITYQYATPQSLFDSWLFWNCDSVPADLPSYIAILDVNPMDAVGNGLSESQANEILNYKKEINT